jgi:hypothetical protein
MTIAISYETIVPLLVEKIPPTRPILEAHVQDNAEILPHVFFGELTRFVIKAFRTKTTSKVHTANGDVADHILDFL